VPGREGFFFPFLSALSLSSLLFFFEERKQKNPLQARNPSFSPFFFARRMRPCTCFVSTPIDLPNSLMTGVCFEFFFPEEVVELLGEEEEEEEKVPLS